MKREYVAFLIGGLLFGILVGFGLANAIRNQPDLNATATGTSTPAPRGPQAPTQTGASGAPMQPGSEAGGGAPMVAEINRLKGKLQQEPENLEVLLRLANLYHDAAMWEQAVGYYERAVALRPAEPDLLTDLGVCYRGLGRFDRALEAFDRAHRLDPRHWQSLFNTAIVATFDTGRADLALEALKSLEAIQPRPPELTAGLDQLRRALLQSAPAGGGGKS